MLKMRDMQQQERKQPPKFRGGNYEKRKQRNSVAGGAKCET